MNRTIDGFIKERLSIGPAHKINIWEGTRFVVSETYNNNEVALWQRVRQIGTSYLNRDGRPRYVVFIEDKDGNEVPHE